MKTPTTTLKGKKLGKNLSRRDNIKTAIPKIALPFIISYLFQAFYLIIDSFWAGKVGESAIVAMATSVFFISVIIAIGTGLGSSLRTYMSNEMGAGNHLTAHRYFIQCVLLTVVLCIIIFPLLYKFEDPMIMLFFHPTTEAMIDTKKYLFFTYVFYAFPRILNLMFNGYFAAIRDGSTFRNGWILAVILNLIIDPMLTLGVSVGGLQIIPPLGVVGLAFSAAFNTSVINIYFIIVFIRKSKVYLRWSHWIPQPKDIVKLLYQATSGFVSRFGVAVAYIIYAYFVSLLSPHYVSGYGIGARLEIFVTFAITGLGMASGGMVGFNNGAKNYPLIRIIARYSILWSFILILPLAVAFAIFGKWLVPLFVQNQEAIYAGVTYLAIVVLVNTINNIIITINLFTLGGIKQPMASAIISLLGQIVFTPIVIPLAYYDIHKSIITIWVAIVIKDALTMLMALFWTRLQVKRLLRKYKKGFTDAYSIHKTNMFKENYGGISSQDIHNITKG